jgi:hypothetical protein
VHEINMQAGLRWSRQMCRIGQRLLADAVQLIPRCGDY